MAKRLAVASLGVATLSYVTSPSTASIVVGLITGLVLWGQWLSHCRSKCDTIPVDESLSS